MLALVLLTGVFVYLQVFILPHTPRFASGDQAIYLHHATRMLHGELIYRDYDHFTLPGTDLLYMALFRAFGIRMWIPQAMLILIGVCLGVLITVASRSILPWPALLLPALLFICIPFSSYLDATHHWYSAIFAIAALAVLMNSRSSGRLAAAGVLTGLATFFTQSMVLLVLGFAIFLIWEWRRDRRPRRLLLTSEAALWASFLATISACVAYFITAVGLKRFFYFTVVFVVKYYPADWFNNWRVYLTGRPHLHDYPSWIDIPAFGGIHVIVPGIYIFFLFWLCWSSRGIEEGLRRRLVLINTTGFFLFLSVASAPAYTRLYVVSIPGLMILVWLLYSWRGGPKLMQLLWAAVLVMFIARPVFTQLRHKEFLNLPTGRTAFFEPLLYDKCAWMLQHSHPGDYYFGDHLVAFALQLKNVGRVPFLRPTDYTRPEEVDDAVQALDKFHVNYVAWYSGLNTETQGHRHPEGDHLDPMWAYLHRHYRPVVTFSNLDQIWERDP